MKKKIFLIIIYCLVQDLSINAMQRLKPKSRIGKKKPSVINSITFFNKSEYDIILKKGRMRFDLIPNASTKVLLSLKQTLDMQVNGHKYEFKKHKIMKPRKLDIHCAWDGLEQVFRIVPHNKPFDARAELAIWTTITLPSSDELSDE